MQGMFRARDYRTMTRLYLDNGTFDVPEWYWETMPKKLKKLTINPGHVYETDYFIHKEDECQSGQ